MNPNTPHHCLRALAEDPSPAVRQALVQNPALPEDLLERFSYEEDPEIRALAVRHPRASYTLRRRLASDPDERVQNALRWSTYRPAWVISPIS